MLKSSKIKKKKKRNFKKSLSLKKPMMFFNKVIILGLIFPLLFNALTSTLVYAEDSTGNVDSNDRRAGSIQLGFQQQGGEGGDIEGVTAEELRTIGIFLSNYYVPFSTQISNKNNSDEVQKESKEKMVTALTTNMQFSEEMAKSIVDSVFTVSSQAQPLYFATGEYQSPGKYKVTGVKNPQGEPRKATFKEFLYQSLGAQTDYTGSSSAYPYFRYNDPRDRGYLYWGTPQKDKKPVDSDKLVFNWNINGGGYTTASQSVLATIYSNLDPNGTIATSVFDIDKKEVDGNNPDKVMQKINEKYGKGETIKGVYEKSFYDWEMYVDAFGNILVNTGEQTYVAVPASMNPYVFKGEGSGVGGAIPINNLQMYSNYRKTGDFKNTAKDGNAYKMTYNLNPNKAFMGENGDRFKITSGLDFADWRPSGWFEWYGTGVQMKDALITQDMMLNFNAKSFADNEHGYIDMGGLNGHNMSTLIDSKNKDNYLTWQKDDKSSINRLTKEVVKSQKENWTNNYPYAMTKSFVNSGQSYIEIQDIRATGSREFKYIGGLSTPDQVGTLMTNGEVDPSTIKSVKSYLEKEDEMPDVNTDIYLKESENRGGVVTLEGNENFNAISANIYLTYVLTSLYGSEDKKDEDDKDSETVGDTEDAILKEFGFVINSRNLPSIKETIGDINKNKENGDNDLTDDQKKEMTIWAYFFLHPTQGSQYLGRWFQTKMNGISLYIHRGITGANEAQATTGLTKYVGFSGYTTMPNLSDMEWTQKMVQLYSDYSVYLIIFVMIIFALHTFLGEFTIVRAILGIISFTLLLSIPPTAIQFSVDTSNAVSNRIFAPKFNYWALVQNQAYISKYNEVASDGAEGKENDYILGLMQLQEADGDSQGMYQNNSTIGSSVTLKWMTPKKNQFFKQVQEELQDKTGTTGAMSLLSQTILKKSLSGETYDPNTNAVYLYRSYADIGNFSRTFYGNTEGDNLFGTGDIAHNFADYRSSLQEIGLGDIDTGYLGGDSTQDNTLKFKIQNGFVNAENNAEGSTTLETKNFKRVFGPISSRPVSQVANTDISKITVGDKVGLENNAFKASMNNMNNHSSSVKDSIKESGEYSSEDLISTGTFGMFTESPYYYFSWNFYDNGISTKPNESGNFKELMLKDNSDYFYNYSIDKGQHGYGAMKDYLDMSTLFNVTIPYMKEANKPVQVWGDNYGPKPYKGIPSDDESASKFTDKNSEGYYKYWHNNNLSRLYNQYTAWVDAMYDTEYSKATTIQYAGKEQKVKDPLDPRSYTIRPMIFSESEMLYYGVKPYELTEVEKKIQQVEKDTRLDLLQLMNYYNFDDVVLNNAASMIATFNFNRIFSQRAFAKPSYELYPQNFELKNFTYDAYLRLILSQATGEDLMTNENVKYKDIYERVVEKGNIFTGLFIVLNDLLAQYAIPATRFIALVMFFLLGIMTLLASTLRKEISLGKAMGTAFIVPLVSFMLINVLLSLVVSFFISNGLTSVTGDLTTTIALGDPTLTLFVLLLINIGVLACFVLVLGKSLKNLISYSKITFSSFKLGLQMIGSTVGQTTSNLAHTFNGTSNTSNYSSSSYSTDSIDGRSEKNLSSDVDDEWRDIQQQQSETIDDINTEGNNNLNNFDINEITENGREKLRQQETVNSYRYDDSEIEDVSGDFEINTSNKDDDYKRKRAEDVSRNEKINELGEKYKTK